jgi:hypothetical protein
MANFMRRKAITALTRKCRSVFRSQFDSDPCRSTLSPGQTIAGPEFTLRYRYRAAQINGSATRLSDQAMNALEEVSGRQCPRKWVTIMFDFVSGKAQQVFRQLRF